MTLVRQQVPSPNHGGARNSHQLVVVHTSEGSDRQNNLASFLANPNSNVSYATCFDNYGDPNVIIECVAPTLKSWSAVAANDWGVHGCCATPAGASAGWSADVWKSKNVMLGKTAGWIAEECARFRIPIQKVNANDIRAGRRGVCGHGDCSAAGAGGSHFDPGNGFPWAWVLSLASGQAPILEPPKRVGGGMDITRTPSGQGYYIVAADGGVFTFGDATFFGSMGGKPLNAAVVDITVRPQGDGYWLVAEDGGVFTFGRAGFHGSMGGQRLNSPVQGIDATPSGEGYWMVGKDGGVFTFGDAGFYGAATGLVRQ
jgi:hypothetical protein